MKKIMMFVVIVFIALALIIAAVSLFYLGPIVKLGIEQFGPQITKVSVNVSSVDVSLLGTASIKDLVVGEPQGYTNPQAIKVGTVSISLEPLSVISNKVIIHSVLVNSPEITFEGGIMGNNLSKILSNVNGASKNPLPAPKIEIDDLLIKGAMVNVDIQGVLSKTVTLPDIHLTGLGKGSNGLTPVELSRDILSNLLTGTLKAVSGSTGGIGQTVSSITGILGNL